MEPSNFSGLAEFNAFEIYVKCEATIKNIQVGRVLRAIRLWNELVESKPQTPSLFWRMWGMTPRQVFQELFVTEKLPMAKLSPIDEELAPVWASTVKKRKDFEAKIYQSLTDEEKKALRKLGGLDSTSLFWIFDSGDKVEDAVKAVRSTANAKGTEGKIWLTVEMTSILFGS